MYQSQFGLARRPFSSTPDPGCVAAVGGMPEAISELEHCAQDGQGIGILTAPAGLGKTVLCGKLAENLKARFAVVFLPNANFPTRRSLLQAILYEMGHPYLRLGEQELRLEFTAAVRDLFPDREGLAIIVDEAHLLHNRLLEELRTATHLVQNGEMLVRVILSGQLELEERLIKKDLAAINQRIVCHSTLSSLSMLESQEYLEHRIDWAGGTLSDLFDPEAVRMICQASDGCPRCLNQLADHSLLAAGGCRESRVQPAHVLSAFEELQQLPLQWNHISALRTQPASSEAVEIVCEPPEADETSGEAPQTACFEWGPDEEEDIDTAGDFSSEEAAELDDEINEAETVIEALAEEESPEPAPPASDGLWAAIENFQFEEEHVEDHYSLLEKGLAPPRVIRESRDWWVWDPVEELRAEEAAFDLPPAPLAEETIVKSLPEPGEEWQPEDLPPARPYVGSPEPPKRIDEMLPLIEAVLGEDCADSPPANLEMLLSNLSAIVNAGSAGEPDAVPFVIDSAPVWEADVALGKSHDVFVKIPADSVPPDLEERIAELILDTHTDLQPLLWNATTEDDLQSPAEPPPRTPGEEPIRDPGDPAPFEELRQSLKQAAADAKSRTSLADELSSRKPAIEYDIVMPEPEEEPPPGRPITRTDTPATAAETQTTHRPYENLFSKIRHKKRA